MRCRRRLRLADRLLPPAPLARLELLRQLQRPMLLRCRRRCCCHRARRRHWCPHPAARVVPAAVAALRAQQTPQRGRQARPEQLPLSLQPQQASPVACWPAAGPECLNGVVRPPSCAASQPQGRPHWQAEAQACAGNLWDSSALLGGRQIRSESRLRSCRGQERSLWWAARLPPALPKRQRGCQDSCHLHHRQSAWWPVLNLHKLPTASRTCYCQLIWCWQMLCGCQFPLRRFSSGTDRGEVSGSPANEATRRSHARMALLSGMPPPWCAAAAAPPSSAPCCTSRGASCCEKKSRTAVRPLVPPRTVRTAAAHAASSSSGSNEAAASAE